MDFKRIVLNQDMGNRITIILVQNPQIENLKKRVNLSMGFGSAESIQYCCLSNFVLLAVMQLLCIASGGMIPLVIPVSGISDITGRNPYYERYIVQIPLMPKCLFYTSLYNDYTWVVVELFLISQL